MTAVITEPIKPCEKCGANRWKTLEKGKRFMCRGTIEIEKKSGVLGLKIEKIRKECGNIRII